MTELPENDPRRLALESKNPEGLYIIEIDFPGHRGGTLYLSVDAKEDIKAGNGQIYLHGKIPYWHHLAVKQVPIGHPGWDEPALKLILYDEDGFLRRRVVNTFEEKHFMKIRVGIVFLHDGIYTEPLYRAHLDVSKCAWEEAVYTREGQIYLEADITGYMSA